MTTIDRSFISKMANYLENTRNEITSADKNCWCKSGIPANKDDRNNHSIGCNNAREILLGCYEILYPGRN